MIGGALNESKIQEVDKWFESDDLGMSTPYIRSTATFKTTSNWRK